jgi:membrane-bound lytic murein transglycosylase D
VRRGDNLSIISKRFGVSQQDIVKWNRLRNRNQIAVGQKLRVAAPTVVVVSAEAARGEATASMAAAPAPEIEPAPQPRIQTKAEVTAEVAAVADSEPTPPAEAPEPSGVEALAALFAAASAPQEQPGAPPADSDTEELDAASVPIPDPSDYAVTPSHRITVQAEETLGHYAEWLEVSASRLRRLNRMRYETPLVIGRQKKLDFSRVTPEEFERRRLEYHRTLQEEFFDAYVVSATRTHMLRKGDSLWYLAQLKYEVPIWLLRQYNPDLDFGSLPAGTPMVVPVIEPSQERS